MARSAFGYSALIVLLVFAPLQSPVYAQQRVRDGVYTQGQAKRGQGTYTEKCSACHGDQLTGGLGPPLVGNEFVGDWEKEALSELAIKIQSTMPQNDPGKLTPQETVDLIAYILQAGKFPSGNKELTPDEAVLKQITWDAGSALQPKLTSQSVGTRSYPPSGNMAQVMRGILFPSSNIIFNVQGHDPGIKLTPPDEGETAGAFNWTVWGSGIYSGWELVDYAAIAIAESAPLLMTPGRRCENGKPVPINDPEWVKFTDELVAAGRAAYKVSQTRDREKVGDITDQVSDACFNCHQVYRDKTPRVVDPRDPSNKAARCVK